MLYYNYHFFREGNMEISNITGAGVVTPGFTTESNRPVRTETDNQQGVRPEPQRIPEENKGNNIDVTA